MDEEREERKRGRIVGIGQSWNDIERIGVHDFKEVTFILCMFRRSVAEATTQRADSKAAHEQAISDDEQALGAVQECMEVMKQFYASAGKDEAAFMQQAPADDAPVTWKESFTPDNASSRGPVALLEQLYTEFSQDKVGEGGIIRNTAGSRGEGVHFYIKIMFNINAYVASRNQ